MDFELTTYFWLSWIFFILHSIEEVRGIEPWARANLPTLANGFYTKERFKVASIILVILYTFLVIWYQLRPNTLSLLVVLIGFYAMTGNAFFHVFQNFVLKSNMPGIWTAVLFLIPMGFVVTCWLIRHHETSATELLVIACLGTLFQFPVVSFALFVAAKIR